jgi:hypothetical protein
MAASGDTIACLGQRNFITSHLTITAALGGGRQYCLCVSDEETEAQRLRTCS